MKKIFIMIITLIVAISTFSFVSCKSSKSGDVKLVSINQVTANTVTYLGMDSKINFVRDIVTVNAADEKQKENQYMLISDDETYFTLKITLDNPNNYYILDFSLESSDENFKVKINDKYLLLTELPSLRWNSDTNYFCELDCCSTEQNYKTIVEMTSLYYSDRTDGSNKYDGDITENNLLNIYRKNNGIELVEQSFFKFKVKVINDKVDKDSLYFREVKINEGDILTLNPGDNLFKFNYIFDEQAIPSGYNNRIEDTYIMGSVAYLSNSGWINLFLDFDKVELYQYGEYKADAIKGEDEQWGKICYKAQFYLGEPVWIPENTYLMVYKDDFIIKISFISSHTYNIEMIQGL